MVKNKEKSYNLYTIHYQENNLMKVEYNGINGMSKKQVSQLAKQNVNGQC